MNRERLEMIRNGRADCPSELDLDHLIGNKLTASEGATLQQHVSGCSICGPKMELRRAGWAAFSRAEPPEMLAEIRRRMAEERAQSSRRFLPRQVRLVLGPLCAAAVLMLWIKWHSDPQQKQTTTTTTTTDSQPVYATRDKGGLALHVVRLKNGIVEPMISGERLAESEALKFKVDLPRAGHVNILGVESSGKRYVAWPGEAVGSTLRPSGDGQELPGAVASDGASGSETLYLVQCPQETGEPKQVCTDGPGTGPPVCPPSCAYSAFMFRR